MLRTKRFKRMIMGGGGSIQNMQNALKNNKNLRSKRANLFKRKSVYSSIKNNPNSGENNIRHLTEKERVILKTKLAKSRRDNIILAAILSTIVSIIVAYVLIDLFKPFQEDFTSAAELQLTQSTNKAYQFFMQDGDEWFAKRNWHNAIFQYKNALEKEPNSFVSKVKLAYSYLNQCKFENEGCVEAYSLLRDLQEELPNNPQVQVLAIEMKDMYLYKNEKANSFSKN